MSLPVLSTKNCQNDVLTIEVRPDRSWRSVTLRQKKLGWRPEIYSATHSKKLLRIKSCTRFGLNFSINQNEGIFKVLDSLMNPQVVVDQIFATPPPLPFSCSLSFCDPMVIYNAYKIKTSMCSYFNILNNSRK